MKIQHLPMGARFEYEGVVYVKTGPMMAASEQGGQRIIPRCATLKALDVPEGKRAGAAGPDTAKVRAAFEEFFASCDRLVDDGGREELVAARERFLAALK